MKLFLANVDNYFNAAVSLITIAQISHFVWLFFTLLFLKVQKEISSYSSLSLFTLFTG